MSAKKREAVAKKLRNHVRRVERMYDDYRGLAIDTGDIYGMAASSCRQLLKLLAGEIQSAGFSSFQERVITADVTGAMWHLLRVIELPTKTKRLRQLTMAAGVLDSAAITADS